MNTNTEVELAPTTKVQAQTNCISGVVVQMVRRVHDNSVSVIVLNPQADHTQSIHQTPFTEYETGREAYFETVRLIREIENKAAV